MTPGASFKQYDYQEGMALDEQVPFEAETLVATIEQGSTINETEGWVQGVPQQAVEDALTDYRTRLENHLASQAPDATVGDVLGAQQIKQVVHEQLAATLPYHLSTRTLVASVLPENLRWKFRYQLSTSQYGQPNAALLTLEDSTVNLAGRKLRARRTPALSALFRPRPFVVLQFGLWCLCPRWSSGCFCPASHRSLPARHRTSVR